MTVFKHQYYSSISIPIGDTLDILSKAQPILDSEAGTDIVIWEF